MNVVGKLKIIIKIHINSQLYMYTNARVETTLHLPTFKLFCHSSRMKSKKTYCPH